MSSYSNGGRDMQHTGIRMARKIMRKKKLTLGELANRLDVSDETLSYMMDKDDSRGQSGPGRHAVNRAWLKVHRWYHRISLRLIGSAFKPDPEDRFNGSSNARQAHALDLQDLERHFSEIGLPESEFTLEIVFDRLGALTALSSRSPMDSIRMATNSTLTALLIADAITANLPKHPVDPQVRSRIKLYLREELLPLIDSVNSGLASWATPDMVLLSNRCLGYARAAAAHLAHQVGDDAVLADKLPTLGEAVDADPDPEPSRLPNRTDRATCPISCGSSMP